MLFEKARRNDLHLGDLAFLDPLISPCSIKISRDGCVGNSQITNEILRTAKGTESINAKRTSEFSLLAIFPLDC